MVLNVQMDVQTGLVCNKMKNKKGMSAWIWILIILILLGVGISLYFLLSGGLPYV